VAEPNVDNVELGRRHSKKVKASKDLVQLYTTLRKNMEIAVGHREKSFAARNAELENVKTQMHSHRESLLTSASSTSKQSEELQQELTSAASCITSQLSELEGSLKDVGQTISELEAKKRYLKMKIEEVTVQLNAKRNEQRKHMQDLDKARQSLAHAKKDFHTKIQSQEERISTADLDRELCVTMQTIIEKTESEISDALTKQIEGLGRKREQFDSHFVEVLKDHCRLETARLVGFGERARIAIAKLASQSIAEHQNLARLCTVVDAVWNDILAFKKEHADFTDYIAEEITQLNLTYQELRHVLAPGVVQMQQLPTAASLGRRLQKVNLTP